MKAGLCSFAAAAALLQLTAAQPHRESSRQSPPRVSQEINLCFSKTYTTPTSTRSGMLSPKSTL